MLSAILLSAALAAGGCSGADYDISFTENGVQSSTADFVKDGDGYVAELPILEGGIIAPGIEEKKTFKVCNQTSKPIRLKSTQWSILEGGTDDFFKDLTVNGIPVKDMTSPLPLQGIDGAELKVDEAANTVLNYNFDFEATSGNRVNAGWQKAIVKIRVEAEYPDPPKTEQVSPPATTRPAPDEPNVSTNEPIVSTPLAVTGAGIIGAIVITGAGIASGGALRRRARD